MKKKCPYCSEEILIEAIKCKHCREFLENEVTNKGNIESSNKKNNRGLIITIIVVVIVFICYTKLKENAEYQRSVYDSYESKSDNYRLPSGKVVDLVRVPSDYKYQVKIYLSYKDKRSSWQTKDYDDGWYGSEGERQVKIFDRIIEMYETEHPFVRENSFKVKIVSDN